MTPDGWNISFVEIGHCKLQYWKDGKCLLELPITDEQLDELRDYFSEAGHD